MGLEFGAASNHTVWQPEPRGRGTYGILSSCVITMILCVWTAVHLNLPEHHGHSYKYLPSFQTVRKIWWMLLGLFAPEIVAWTAYEQHRKARRLYYIVKGILGEELPSSKYERFKNWLGQQGGGKKRNDIEKGKGTDRDNVVEMLKDGERVLAASDNDGTMLAGMRPMRTQPFDPASDSCSVEGKRAPISGAVEAGTASSVENATTQPTMVDLTRGRKHVWTMTHSHYAIMGGFAFDSRNIGDGSDFLPGKRKRVTLTAAGLVELLRAAPHLLPDISEGYIKDKSKANNLAKIIVCLQASWFAAQCVSRMALGMTISLLELNTFAHAICALISYLLWWQKPLDVEEPTLVLGKDADLVCAGLCIQTNLGSELSLRPQTGVDFESFLPQYEAGLFHYLYDYQDVAASELQGNRTMPGFSLVEDSLNWLRKHRPDEYLPLSNHPDLLRFRKAKECYIQYARSMTELWARDGEWWLVDRARNWPNSNTKLHVSSDRRLLQSMSFSLFIAGLAYGGLHLLAWSPPVQTVTEVLLWRISGIAIIAWGAILEAFAFFSYLPLERDLRVLDHFTASFKALFTRFMPERVQVFLGTMLALYVGYAMLLYPSSRIYLVVECFNSVRYLPESAFETPHWAEYLPHFG
ncbi:hypothetical protein B0T21DRAFT_407173 [Apiosordaria backusii]|uniref:Uncharacterized protein n=1 Tax=Apiosordaria backusii TaxID=314023 RepID=A0AA40K7W5_9PEZI|nr:hypothetical protein B0T21DRAFT_407173 [Apiosordaria backusii]